MSAEAEGRPLEARHEQAVVRRAITVSGVIQGVGFRPFVHRLAEDLGLTGWVRNQIGAVVIEVEGRAAVIDRFEARLVSDAPPGAHVEHIERADRPPNGASSFRIRKSLAQRDAPVRVPADLATCDDCLEELFAPPNRRHRYPFISCTACGPRLSVLRGVPYDRAETTMSPWPLCADCRAEYGDSADRRFHAETTGCHICGPHLFWMTPSGEHARSPALGTPAAVAELVSRFAQLIRDDKIGALKSSGGYHLVVDASSEAAVRRLRERKARPDKPFAIMVADLSRARELAVMSPAAEALLTSPARPVLLVQRDGSVAGAGRTSKVAPSVTRGSHLIGVMLPSTPLQHLLLAELGGPLVMTSGNVSDAPLIYEDDEAREVLGTIADGLLGHELEIHQRLDDSVFRGSPAVLPLRRSRGFAPLTVPLGDAVRVPTLAVGAQAKVTFALATDAQAIVSHHVGDLHDYGAIRELEHAVARYEALHGIHPLRIVHDLHPDYASTSYAVARSAAEGLERVTVQHHHAHVASCLAERGVQRRALGVAFDGTGYGTDGAIWGGEFLLGTRAHVERFAHLAYVPMPGGSQAVREPWRMAVAHALNAGLTTAAARLRGRVDEAALHFVASLAERRVHAPLTSSIGRLFDAVASLLGLVDRATYDGHGPMLLEALSADVPTRARYQFAFVGSPGPLLLDPAPVVRAILDDLGSGIDVALIARAFHEALASAVVEVAERARRACSVSDVVLTGGVFANGILASECEERLIGRGFTVHLHHLVPPNDGGISHGQLAVVAARDRSDGGI